MKANPQYTIVGFGIAGATLAWQFYFTGIPFNIVAAGNSSSRVAAGMMNPIVFKRITKSWMVDEFLPFAEKLYTAVENKTGMKLLVRNNIRRLFVTKFESDKWNVLQADENPIALGFKNYLAPAENLIDGTFAPFGNGIVNTIGSLNVTEFLDASEKYFIQNGVAFEKRKFNDDEIEENGIYIFCEGYEIANNRWFSYLPTKPSHGEVLMIKCPGLKTNDIINRSCFIQPLGNDIFRVGATFAWHLTTPQVTAEGRQELVEKLQEILTLKFEVIDQHAGIRCVVPDRRPLVGRHPEKKNLFVFAGLGPKGVMCAPYLAENLATHLVDGANILKEVDVVRWHNRFQKFRQAEL